MANDVVRVSHAPYLETVWALRHNITPYDAAYVALAMQLTAPAVLAIDLFTHHPVLLGLDPANSTLMLLTLGVSIITFSSGRTNVLQGAVHLLLFVAYLVLIFSP